MPVTKGIKALIAEARENIETMSIEDARAGFEDGSCVPVDIRDVRELEREGMVPGAFHAPRGMLEFWVDPDSPYFKEFFATDKKMVLYCQSAWRSSLATAALKNMGLDNVAHFEGGFKAWKEAGFPVAQKD